MPAPEDSQVNSVLAEWQQIQNRMFYMSQAERQEALCFLERSKFVGENAILNDIADEATNELLHVLRAAEAAAMSGTTGEKYARAMLFARLELSQPWLRPGSSAMIRGAAKATFLLNNESILSAEQDPTCFDVACVDVGLHVLNDWPLTDAAKHFAFRVLSGKLKRPAQKGANPFTHMFRDRQIVEAIVVGKFYGLPATRNDVSAENSGCDAVADFMRTRGLRPQTFSAVKRIWLSRGDTDRRFSITMHGLAP